MLTIVVCGWVFAAFVQSDTGGGDAWPCRSPWLRLPFMRQQPEHDGVGALAPNYPALALQALDPKPKALERSHGGHVARVGVALEAMQVKVAEGEVHDPSLGLVRVALAPVLPPEDEAQLRSRLLAVGQQRDRPEHTAVLVALDAPLQHRAVVEPVSDLA